MSPLDEVETMTRGQAYLRSLAGRRVTVVGLAKSGIAAARLLRAAGADVVGTDAKPIGALGREAAGLAEIGVRLVAGAGETAAAFADAELVVVSPGVPLDGDQLARVRARQVPIIGELELGWRAMEADTIAITGTNGKTTTTALIGAVLAQQPRPVLIAGNIGTPLSAHALSFPADGLVVCEVSSWKLDTSHTTRPSAGNASACAESGVPMLPATRTGRGCWASTAPISAVVVVLPLVPVIAIVSASIARQPSSSSPMIGTCRARAAASWAPSGGIPGLTTTSSVPAKAAAVSPVPASRRTPRSASAAASRPRAATGFTSVPITSAPAVRRSRAAATPLRASPTTVTRRPARAWR